MTRTRIVFIAIAALAITFAATISNGQVPPHRPGSVCYTPQFWCWWNPPGQPGAACACPSPYGRVMGRLG
jgi:hypothetical protein